MAQRPAGQNETRMCNNCNVLKRFFFDEIYCQCLWEAVRCRLVWMMFGAFLKSFLPMKPQVLLSQICEDLAPARNTNLPRKMKETIASPFTKVPAPFRCWKLSGGKAARPYSNYDAFRQRGVCRETRHTLGVLRPRPLTQVIRPVLSPSLPWKKAGVPMRLFPVGGECSPGPGWHRDKQLGLFLAG